MKRWASKHFWTRNPVEESSDDNDEHEEVFTLGRMSTRSQTRVSRYFTHVEIEADIEEARALEELEEGPWHNIDPSDDEEPVYDETDDEEFNEDAGGDEDVADENM